MKALVLLALLSGLSGASGAVLAAGEKPPPLLLTGELQPVATVKVYARAAGAVIKVHVRESYPITEGQVLSEIDPREYEIEVAESGVVFAGSGLGYPRQFGLGVAVRTWR